MKMELQPGSRSKILAGVVIAIASVFAFRLFYLQIIRHDHYQSIASQEQIKRLTIPAKRGAIYAMDGTSPVPLVLNQTVYTVFADPQLVSDDNRVMEVLNEVAGGELRPEIDKLLARKDTRYQILAAGVSRKQADLIKQEGLRGIGFQETSQRVYPEGNMAAQLLGFVDYSGTGRYGVEGGLNERLAGQDGLLQSVTDVSDVPLTIGNRNISKPAVDGENLVLSIDRNVQARVDQALKAGLKRSGATEGSVVVMNPQNGQVMAMVNLPDYNPAEFNKVTDANLFNNPIVSLPYEQGSNIKVFTYAMGLDLGVIKPSTTFVNTDTVKIDDRVIGNAAKGQTGAITFQHALNWSLNTGSVEIMRRMGDGTITRDVRNTTYDYFYNKFKLGQLTGVELSGEAAGSIISPDKTEGNAVRYSNMSFGQGMDLTMMQTASAFGALVNGGKYYQPTVLAGKLGAGGELIEKGLGSSQQVISVSAANSIRSMMENGRKTFYSSIDKRGYRIGGKTGTAEVIKNGQYSKDESIGTYLGFGGDDLARYVIMVKMSGENRYLQGARDAIPVFTEISNWMIDYLRLQPKE